MPLEVFTVNRHRFGMFLEVFRFLYDLMSMHLTIRKSYYDTFLAKVKQFTKYFYSVKDTKRLLSEDQNQHNLKNSMLLEKIKEIKQVLSGLNNTISKKSKQIKELDEELGIQEEEVETVILDKATKLEKAIQIIHANPISSNELILKSL